MIPSPFHGIFSASVQSDEVVAPRKVPAKTAHTPMMEMDTKDQERQESLPGQGIGQVALDIFQYDDYYIIKAPIAGVRLSDLDIEVSKNVLTIRGTRRQTDTIAEDKYYLKECFWGEFQRSVTLPCTIDPRKIKATFNKDSVLKILVPREDEKVKIIRIND